MMKINQIKTRRKGAFAIIIVCIVALFTFLFSALKLPNDGGMYALNTVNAAAYDAPSIEVQSYEVRMVVRQDRKVEVQENIKVKFLQNHLTMFYRMLAKEGTRYYDIQASCEGNKAFTYYVADNPDYSDFLDINCVGGAEKGNVWTYQISYTMEESTGKMQDNFIVDVIGFGWPVALHNVKAEVHFPDKAENIQCYVGGYGVQNGVQSGVGSSSAAENLLLSVSEDGKTLRMSAAQLKLQYNDVYGERMAAGFTVQCQFANGVLADYTTTRIYTKNMPWILLGGVACILLSMIVCFITRKKRTIITTVNVTAPDEMDPMKMGKWLDGVVDNEDVTSMIYYFADKGYLEIDLSDEDDPVLIKKADLPADAPVYVETLFDGLFKRRKRVAVSQLAERYYLAVDIAKRQLFNPKMYEKKSILGFMFGGILGALYATITPFIIAKANLHITYNYFSGAIAFMPVLFMLFFAFIRENYHYKWKKSVYIATFAGIIAVGAIATLGCVAFMGSHLMTGYEIAVMDICCFASTLICTAALSRKQAYVDELGQILGFKDFIVYTEEDKIKFMLEENPQLYYKVLPYAQVLGVTNEWEGKFANILIPAPTWCTNSHMTVFDYMILNRCMHNAMMVAMRPPQSSTGGRSGGGGSFGGFGGGGFGGGGGGAR